MVEGGVVHFTPLGQNGYRFDFGDFLRIDLFGSTQYLWSVIQNCGFQEPLNGLLFPRTLPESVS